VAFSHKAGQVLNVCLTVLCLYFDSIYDVSFTDLKEDPHCVMMQSSTKTHESLTQGTDDQNCNNDKTPIMEEKLQEVEKVMITFESYYPSMSFLSWKMSLNTVIITIHDVTHCIVWSDTWNEMSVPQKDT
jgi:hypothetical protein